MEYGKEEGEKLILKGKSTFVKIQGDILWAGRHKLFVSFGVSFTFLQLLAGEEFRTAQPVGQSWYSDSRASKDDIILWLSLILFVFERPLSKGRGFWRLCFCGEGINSFVRWQRGWKDSRYQSPAKSKVKYQAEQK